MNFCIVISITDKYLIFTLSHHGQYSDHFREIKFLCSVSPLQIKSRMVVFIVYLGGIHFFEGNQTHWN